VQFLDEVDAYQCERCQPRVEIVCGICQEPHQEVYDHAICTKCSPRPKSAVIFTGCANGLDLARITYDLMRRLARDGFTRTRRLGRDPDFGRLADYIVLQLQNLLAFQQSVSLDPMTRGDFLKELEQAAYRAVQDVHRALPLLKSQAEHLAEVRQRFADGGSLNGTPRT